MKNILITFISALAFTSAYAQKEDNVIDSLKDDITIDKVKEDIAIDSVKKEHRRFRHEIRLGIGGASLLTLTEGVHAGEDGYDSRTVTKYSGTVSLTYRYKLFKWMSVGLAAAYEQENGDMKDFVSQPAVTKYTGTYRRQALTLAPEFQYNLPNKKERRLSAYGYLGIGVCFMNELDTYSPEYYSLSRYYNGVNQLGNNREFLNDRTKASFQFCPIGIVLSGNLGGYAEVGFGYKGIFNCGLILKL
jgi:hypothetical protein